MEHCLSALTKALLGMKTLSMTKSNDEKEETYLNIHRAIKTLLDTIPRAAPQLVPTLNKHYPFRNRGSDIQVQSYTPLSRSRGGLTVIFVNAVCIVCVVIGGSS